MSERFFIERHEHLVEVESDESLTSASLRLLVDGKVADEGSAFWGRTLRAEIPDEAFEVEVEYGTLGGVSKCVLISDGTEYPMQKIEPGTNLPETTAHDPEKPSDEAEWELLDYVYASGDLSYLLSDDSEDEEEE